MSSDAGKLIGGHFHFAVFLRIFVLDFRVFGFFSFVLVWGGLEFLFLMFCFCFLIYNGVSAVRKHFEKFKPLKKHPGLNFSIEFRRINMSGKRRMCRRGTFLPLLKIRNCFSVCVICLFLLFVFGINKVIGRIGGAGSVLRRFVFSTGSTVCVGRLRGFGSFFIKCF